MHVVKSAGNQFKEFRQGNAISIRQLSLKTGVDRTKISRWENGRGHNMIREAIIVAKSLNTTVEALFGE